MELIAGERPRILIVDDNPKNIQLLGSVLREEGYQTHFAQEGAQALNIVEKVEPDLILLDVMMPKLDGMEVCRCLKALKSTRDIPIIFLTAKTESEDIIAGLEMGAVDYVTKPFNAAELLARVKTHLKLRGAFKVLERQNLELQVSNNKMADTMQTKTNLLLTMHQVEIKVFGPLLEKLHKAMTEGQADLASLLQQVAQDLHQIETMLLPFRSLFLSEQAIQSKKVLLAESNKKQQLIAKMAMMGSGAGIDIVSTVSEGETKLNETGYDILFVDVNLIDIARLTHQKWPDTQIVLMTSQAVGEYLPLLQRYPYLTNTVSRNEEDRTFSLKNISSTISKLLSKDLFGMEKYLNWGVEVQRQIVTDSESRPEMIEKMAEYLQTVGVRKTIISKCEMVAEELLMNAIYDAPTNAEGKPLYNHLPRTEAVMLKPEQQGQFRYACDGLVAAVSVQDPFGSLRRSVILKYLHSCMSGAAGTLQHNKGGAGRGLYHIIETSDLVVINVKSGIKTELIAFFNIDPNAIKINKYPSFHYFGDLH